MFPPGRLLNRKSRGRALPLPAAWRVAREEEEEGGAVRCWSHVGKRLRQENACPWWVGVIRSSEGTAGYFYTDFSININQVHVKYMRE